MNRSPRRLALASLITSFGVVALACSEEIVDIGAAREEIIMPTGVSNERWLAGLDFEPTGGCTGSLVAAQWVLTARHCLKPPRHSGKAYFMNAAPVYWGRPFNQVWWSPGRDHALL